MAASDSCVTVTKQRHEHDVVPWVFDFPGYRAGRVYWEEKQARAAIPSRLHPKSVLTINEQPMYWRLVEAFSPDLVVLAQVSFSQLVQAKGGNNLQNLHLFRRISQKTADFVICRKDFTVVAVIELDDSSHRNKRDKDAERDAFLRPASRQNVAVSGPCGYFVAHPAMATRHHCAPASNLGLTESKCAGTF
ncbi:DUF2726 domain-containing protein [Chitiniphilus eburneus]|nr:DUF2726 domain-containing protein [Chitiniphilus eburneus]